MAPDDEIENQARAEPDYTSLREEAQRIARRLLDDDGQLNRRAIAALEELERIIQATYPKATFRVTVSDEPVGFHLNVTVDLDDTEQVGDLVIDRLLEYQVEEGLAVHVIPLRTPERVLAELRARQSRAAQPRKDG